MRTFNIPGLFCYRYLDNIEVVGRLDISSKISFDIQLIDGSI